MDLNFIADEKLRTRIADSIKYISALLENESLFKNNESRQETYRIVILYCVSIMEAIFLYIHHNSKDKIYKQEYKDVAELSERYINTQWGGKVMVAVRTEMTKKELEIGFQELVTFYKDKMLKEDTLERIKRIAQKRNTFHFRKNGSNDCTLDDVEEALALLNMCINNSPRFLK